MAIELSNLDEQNYSSFIIIVNTMTIKISDIGFDEQKNHHLVFVEMKALSEQF